MRAMDDLTRIVRESASASDKKKTSAYDTTAEVLFVEGNTAYVHIPEGVERTPASMVVNAKPGDTVRVRVAGGKAYVTGNATSPPTDDTYAKKAETQAIRAAQAADTAVEKASVAERSANSAIANAEIAKNSADAATKDAGAAKAAADKAQADAESAQTDADLAHDAADAARQDARDAHDAADEANASAILAHDAADDAMEKATLADAAAGNAIQSANTALKQLEVIEDVVNVVEWVSTHGYYSYCTETAVVENKVYYTLTGAAVASPEGNPSGNHYYELKNNEDIAYYARSEDASVVSGKTYYTVLPTHVDEPSGNPSTQPYYQMELDEAVAQYVNAHLYLTDDGLWVSSDNESRYKVLITSTDFQVRDTEANRPAIKIGVDPAVDPNKPVMILGVNGNNVMTIDDEKAKASRIIFTELYPATTNLVLISRSSGHFSIKKVD